MRALIRDSTGYRYRGAVGDDVVFTSKTDYADPGSVDTVVDAELAEATDAENTVAIGMAIAPRNDDDSPFDDFDLGDAVSAANIDGTHEQHRTVAIPVTESPLGVVRFGLELNARVENEAARKQRWLEQITPGALSGRADSVSALDLGAGVPFGPLRRDGWVFNQNGPLVAELDYSDPEDEGHSDDWPVDEPILMYRVRWALTQAGDTATVVHLRINGGGPFNTGAPDYVPFFHAITIPAGATAPDDDSNDGQYTNQIAGKGDTIRAAVYQAGDYARGLVVRVKHTTQT